MERTLLSTILFDLIGTLVYELDDLNTPQGFINTQVKVIHDSLEQDGIRVDWNLWKYYYEQVRNRQKTTSEQTLREYDMCVRVSDTLGFLNQNVPSTSPIIRKAIDAYMDVYISFMRTKESAYESLRNTAVKYQLGLVTDFACHPAVYRILDRFTLRDFFKTIVISGELGYKKPSSQIFETALNKLSAKAEETVFVGDSYKTDIIGAKNMGMKTILISKDVGDFEKADIQIKNLKELPTAIMRL